MSPRFTWGTHRLLSTAHYQVELGFGSGVTWLQSSPQV